MDNLETHPVNDSVLINDIRIQSEFRGISFSKYKLTDVKTALLESIMKGKAHIETSCNWTAELVCSGHFMDIWEVVLHYLGKYIHLGNPRLTVYLENRFTIFRNIISQTNYTSELQLRNNTNIRKLFAEVICLISFSPRKHSFEPVKINREEEFVITQMTERLFAPNITFVEPIFKKDDPKELYIAINEFAFAISPECKDLIKACYWIEWVVEFDLICTKRKKRCICERRTWAQVENKHQKDLIWLIWDAIMNQMTSKSEFIQKTMHSLLQLFCIKYTTGSCKKRRYLLYFAVGLLTEPVQENIELISIDNKKMVSVVTEQIDKLYKQIKKNEENPGTDYLFGNIHEENNTENSMRKLEMMDKLLRPGG
jgi:hypothetical protein